MVKCKREGERYELKMGRKNEREITREILAPSLMQLMGCAGSWGAHRVLGLFGGTFL